MFNRGDTIDDTADTNIDVPSSEQDTDLDLGTISGDITGTTEEATADLDTSTEIDTGLDTSDEIDTGIDVPSSEQDTDLNIDVVDNISGSVITPDVDRPTDVDNTAEVVDVGLDAGSIATPEVDADVPDIERPTPNVASGMFDRGDTINDAVENTSVDVPSSEQDTDLNLDVANANIDPEATTNLDDLDASTEIEPSDNVLDLRQDADVDLDSLIDNLVADTTLENVDSPDSDITDDTSTNVIDLRLDEPNPNALEDIDVDSASPEIDLSLDDADDRPTDVTGGINRGGAAIAGGGAALGSAAASGLFDRDEDTSSTAPTSSSFDLQDFETFETSFDLSAEPKEAYFADNVVADAETSSIDKNDDLSEMTLDSVAEPSNFDLDEMTLGNVDRDINTSLEEITFDDAGADELSVDDITLDNADNKINADLDEITFDSDSTTNYSLEEITFDDVEANANFDLDDATDVGEAEEISLDDLGFEESNSANAASFELLDDSTAEITSISNEESNDMNNISQWLDSIDTPKKDNDSISDWLDALDKDSVRNPDTEQNPQERETTGDLSEDADDDISFQFLEDLLDRDDRNNQ